MSKIPICRVAMVVAFLLSMSLQAIAGDHQVSIPWRRDTFVPGSGCQWQSCFPSLRKLEHNEHYLAPPRPDQDWDEWYAQMRSYRNEVRSGLHASEPGTLTMEFDGVRSWIRVAGTWGFAVDPMPGETISFQVQARWLSGNNQLCLAFDFCDRQAETDGIWRGWSTVVAATRIPKDRKWHACEVTTLVPDFDRDQLWARPILGMDGTFNREVGTVELRALSVVVPANRERTNRFAVLTREAVTSPGFDDSIYGRDDLCWMSRNFVCGFIFMYDRSFWNPTRHDYQVEALCDEANREFGGFDSVVLWHDYPRIGADDRNQFDFFRHMPGGLAGLQKAVHQFQQRGVKVFIPYMPWDTGTRREPLPDQKTLASIVRDIDADGVFLDTMLQSPLDLRMEMDSLKSGVVFAPEGHPAIAEMEKCSGSWAQWLQPFAGIGALHLKWLEPRHIQHQIHRWDTTHQAELAAAWINGSGVLVWENVFGSFNPWNAQDRADLRRMVPVLRHFAPLLASEDWLPCFPTCQEKVLASCWQGKNVRLWTLVNQGDQPIEDRPVLEVQDRGQQFVDLWRGVTLVPKRIGDRLQVVLSVERYSAVAAVSSNAVLRDLKPLLAIQSQVANLAVPPSDEDPHVAMRSVIVPEPANEWPQHDVRATISSPQHVPLFQGGLRGAKEEREVVSAPTQRPSNTDGMLLVRGGTREFVVRHMRRECGCYPDPETPREQWRSFLTGNPHSGTLEHQLSKDVATCWIDRRPVTNAEFDAFLETSGYQPRCRDRFLEHWHGTECPLEMRTDPVVYVDLDDARAYAKWAGKRLPTEWQWQAAAQELGEQFAHSRVHEWTESLRDDGHTRFVILRGGCSYQAKGSIWYFPGGPQPIDSHAKFLLLYPGLDRCSTIGFRCVAR